MKRFWPKICLLFLRFFTFRLHRTKLGHGPIRVRTVADLDNGVKMGADCLNERKTL